MFKRHRGLLLLVLSANGLVSLNAESFAESVPQPVISAPEEAQWWDGFGDWTQRGLPQPAHALLPYAGSLVVGGDFLTVPGNAIAAWDGMSWSQFGAGVVRGNPCQGIPDCLAWVEDMVEYRGDLVVAGKFNYADGQTVRANNIARWDGASWHQLSSGLNDIVWGLCVYNDELVASGRFTMAGGRSISYIARWNGQLWQPMGELSDYAVSFAVREGELVAAGPFNRADGQPVPHIARWNGSSWTPFGGQVVEDDSDLLVYRDSLIANVVHLVDGFNRPLISRWNGSAWDPLGPGLDALLGSVFSLESYNDRIIAGGRFSGQDMTLHNIATWENSQWVSLGSGVSPGRGEDGAIRDMAVYDGSLYVGGRFTAAGGHTSWFIARWDDVISPVQLESFDAEWHDSFVRLAWQFSPAGFQDLGAVHVQRSEHPEGPYVDLGGVPGVPEVRMVYDDHEVAPRSTYYYRLRLLEQDGQEHLTRPIAVHGGRQIDRLLLYPLRDSDTGPIMIRYAIGTHQSPVRLGIYSPTGQLVRSLDQGRVLPGEHVRSWDRRTQNGMTVARGVYLVHLSTGSAGATQKVVLLNR